MSTVELYTCLSGAVGNGPLFCALLHDGKTGRFDRGVGGMEQLHLHTGISVFLHSFFKKGLPFSHCLLPDGLKIENYFPRALFPFSHSQDTHITIIGHPKKLLTGVF